MRASKKADRAMTQLAKMLADFGIEQETIEEIKETAPTDRLAISRQGEAVLLWLESPAKFTTKVCKREACGQPFGTNYRSVAYCSDNCRARDVSNLLGIKWDWTRATEEERWGGEPPLIIPPAAMKNLLKYVRFFADTLPTQIQTQNLPESTTEYLDQARQTAEQLPALEKLLQSNASVPVPDTYRTNLQQSPPASILVPDRESDEQDSPFDFD